MFPELINANGLPKNTERCDDTLTAYNGSNIRHYGTVTIPCRYNSTDGFQETKFYVADTQGPVIFGYKTCTKLGLVTVNCEITAKSESNKTSMQTFQSVEDLMNTLKTEVLKYSTFEVLYKFSTSGAVQVLF